MLLLREIITPTESSFTMHLPKEMIGKTVEVIAFEINGQEQTPDKEQRLKEIDTLTKVSLVDLSNFKFNRDKANDYDE